MRPVLRRIVIPLIFGATSFYGLAGLVFVLSNYVSVPLINYLIDNFKMKDMSNYLMMFDITVTFVFSVILIILSSFFIRQRYLEFLVSFSIGFLLPAVIEMLVVGMPVTIVLMFKPIWLFLIWFNALILLMRRFSVKNTNPPDRLTNASM